MSCQTEPSCQAMTPAAANFSSADDSDGTVKVTKAADIATAKVGHGKRILHLFSGPAGRVDGLLSFARAEGADGEDWDIENGECYDLLDDIIYGDLLARIKAGYFDAGMLGPPCGTFSNARRLDDQGPRPLRAPGVPGIYGLKDLDVDELKAVKEGTLLALRAAEVFGAFVDLRRPVILEQPGRRKEPEAVSMFDLPEFEKLAERDGVAFTEIAQCAYGAPTAKPTTLLHYMVTLDDAKGTCNHAAKWWRLPSSGAWRFGPHPPLKGKEWWIPAERWRADMLLSPEARRLKFRDKPFLTCQAAAYPAELNRYLALKLLAEEGGKDDAVDLGMKLVGQWRNVLVRKRSRSRSPAPVDQIQSLGEIQWKDPLKGEQAHFTLENDTLGGLRHPRHAVSKLPGLRTGARESFEQSLASCEPTRMW